MDGLKKTPQTMLNNERNNMFLMIPSYKISHSFTFDLISYWYVNSANSNQCRSI